MFLTCTFIQELQALKLFIRHFCILDEEFDKNAESPHRYQSIKLQTVENVAIYVNIDLSNFTALSFFHLY